MAWLYATPKPAHGTKRAEHEQDKPKISRYAALKQQGVTPPMPPNSAPHIINRLVDIGLTGSNGMEMIPLPQSEIAAWQTNSCVRLAPWEAKLIRRLSTEYVSERGRAESETCPPPWRAPITNREIETEEARLRAVLG
jgi:hypothetical protein